MDGHVDRAPACRAPAGADDPGQAARSTVERAAAAVCATGCLPVDLLRAAVARDPALEVAQVHVAAPGAARRAAPTARLRWDRQHVEIVRAARLGDVDRAEALLRDHVREFGCDPLAVLAVLTQSGGPRRLADLRGADCHCPWGSAR